MSNRITRRQVLAMLGASAVTGVLAACQGAKPTTAPTAAVQATNTPKPTATPVPAEPTVITFVDSDFGVTQIKESIDTIVDALNEKMQSEGVNIELKVMLLDNRREKYPLLYAGGTPFTFAFDAPWLHMNAMIEQENFRALEELLPQFPNIVKAFTQEVLDVNYMQGHIYGLPTGFYVGPNSGIIYRQDLLEKYGMPEPKSFEDLELFFAEVKKSEKDMVPYAIDLNSNGTGYWPHAPWRWFRPKDHPVNSPGPGTQVKDALLETPTYVDVETTDWWQAAAERDVYWNENGWFSKKPSAEESWGVYETLFFPGKAAAVGANEPQIYVENLFLKSLQQFVPEGKIGTVELTGQEQGFFMNWATLRQWNFQVFNQHVPEEEAKAGLQFFDWLLGDQDNIDIWLFGIDGVNYIKKPNMRFADIEGMDAATNYRRQWYVAGVPGRFQRIPDTASDRFQQTLELLTNIDYFLLNPIELFDPDRKPVEIEIGQLDAASQEMTTAVLLQYSVDEARAKYKEAMDQAGRPQVREYLQTALDRWIADNKQKYDATREVSQAKYEEWKKTTYAEWEKANPLE